ncbi:uncharacterized protein LOC122403582 [Colletes gigas]|uniref:uncharacterized protein LOC122403582 n=1 Tax=Colletes gigas TaxID=935657 RepID=UPI001C9A74B8|nr:uncharacterized protein LOC122403582 [Colletes gigas]
MDKNNREHLCRVLLDGGSQSNFITEQLANKLQLTKNKINLTFSGLGQHSTRAEYYVHANIKSRTNAFSTEVKFISLPSITGLLPSRQVNRNALTIPKNIKSADPEFHKPGQVNALLGNALFYNLLNVGQIKLYDNSIILQKTQLGWLVTGEINLQQQYLPSTAVSACHVATSLENQITKFWSIEEIPCKGFNSPEKIACEEHFVKHKTRNSEGRYVVRLPFNDKVRLLDESKYRALRRFYALEQKFSRAHKICPKVSNFTTAFQSHHRPNNTRHAFKALACRYTGHTKRDYAKLLAIRRKKYDKTHYPSLYSLQ